MGPAGPTGRDSGGGASVVIVSYRPGDWLDRCIRSVMPQAAEVIVVDNGSDEESASAVARAAGATAVRSPRNLGFAGGVNLGISKASRSSPVIALLNDDATAPPGWLESSCSTLEDGSIAAVGPKVVLEQRFRELVLPDAAWRAPGDERDLGRQIHSVKVAGREVLGALVGAGIHRLEASGSAQWRWTAGPVPFYVPVDRDSDSVVVDDAPAPAGSAVRLINSAGIYLRGDAYAGDIGVGAPDDGRFDRPADRFGVSFTAVVCRRETWDRLGPLAPPFFAYYEDTDWCWRARLAGLRLRYDPTSTVVHRWSATSGGTAAPGVRELAESNRTLTILRNAPRSIVARHLRERRRDGLSDRAVRRAARHLPWAAATRMQLRRRVWTTDPEEVWSTWAGRDCEWDVSPGVTP